MIKNLYIMRENGILLYAENLGEGKVFDENVLIGFFASLANFGREAFGVVAKNVDLGNNNKLIMAAMPKEELLAAAIASEDDDSILIQTLLRGMLRDFADEFYPEYIPEKIDDEATKLIVKNNLNGKIASSMKKRVMISWFIFAISSILLLLLSAVLVQMNFDLYDLNDIFLEGGTISAEIAYVIFCIITLIVFPLPTLICGYITADKHIAVLNSFMFILLMMIMYFLFFQPIFAYAVLVTLPVEMITSGFFSYFGFKIASKNKLSNQ